MPFGHSLRLPVFYLLPSLLLLTACGEQQPVRREIVTTVTRVAVVPDEAFMADCQPKPARRPVAGDDDLGLLVNDLRVWGEDCAGRFSRLRDEVRRIQKDIAAPPPPQ